MGAWAMHIGGSWSCSSGTGGSSVIGLSNPLTANIVGSGYNITGLTMLSNASVNNVITVTAPPYNAKGDGVTDDLGAYQGAINASFGLMTNPTTAGPFKAHGTVYAPVPPVCYLHSAPIRIYGGNLELKGDKGSSLCQNYIGPSVIQNAWGNANLAYDPALVGTGNSLKSISGNVQESIDLANFLDSTKGGTGINALGAGFNISFFIKETGADGQILYSAPAYPGTGNGAFQFAYNGSHQVIAKVNTVSGGLITIGTCTAQAANTVYEIELDWDGATYRLWQGVPGGTAVSCGTQTSSNRMTAGVFEDMSLPANGPHEFWPDGSSYGGAGAFVGDLDSLRFEGQSVHTSAYTVPSAKSTADGYTMLLLNWDASLDGTQIGYGEFGGVQVPNVPAKIYFTVLDENPVHDTASTYMHDLDLCSLGVNGGGVFWAYPTEGLFANAGNNSTWERMSCDNTVWGQADAFDNDYLAHFEHWGGSGGHYGLNLGAAWNNSSESYTQIDGTDVACEIYQGGGGGSHQNYQSKCIDRGNLRYAWIENQSQANYYNPFVDQEAPNANFLANFLLDAAALPYVFTGGNIDTRNGAPYIQQDNGGYGSIFNGMEFNTFGEAIAASYIIDVTNGTCLTPNQLNSTQYPSFVPLSNNLACVNVQGAINSFNQMTNRCRGTGTLSGGTGTITNVCITATGLPYCVDTTTFNNIACTPGAGSMTVAGTGTDTFAWTMLSSQ